jgi:hypothetical protein
VSKVLVFGQQLAEGGSDAWKNGSLRRYLKPVNLAKVSSDASTNTATVFGLTLQGLSDVLTCHIAVGIAGPDGEPVLPADYPATPGTMQLIPVVKNPEIPRLYLREVFQDPTSVTNVDAPLPQAIPFGWSFEPEGADEVRIEITIPVNAYTGSEIVGTLVCAVTVSYSGDWQDTEAVTRALGAVRLMGEPDQITIGSGGG